MEDSIGSCLWLCLNFHLKSAEASCVKIATEMKNALN